MTRTKHYKTNVTSGDQINHEISLEKLTIVTMFYFVKPWLIFVKIMSKKCAKLL